MLGKEKLRTPDIPDITLAIQQPKQRTSRNLKHAKHPKIN